jgi:integrase
MARICPIEETHVWGFSDDNKQKIITKLTNCLETLEANPYLVRAQKSRISLREEDTCEFTPSIDLIESLWERNQTPLQAANSYLKTIAHRPNADEPHLYEEIRNVAIALYRFVRDFQCSLDSLNVVKARAILEQVKEYEWHDYRQTSIDTTADDYWLNEPEPQIQPQQQSGLSLVNEPIAKPIVDIEDVLKGYEQELINNEKSPKHIKAIMRSCRLAHDILESPDMASVSRDDANRVLAQLKLFPKNANNGKQRPHFLGLSANEIIEKNESLKFDVRKSDQSLVDMGNVSTVYRWAMRHNKISYNPFEGLGGSKSKSNKRTLGNITSQKQKKLPFTRKDLKEIFSHPVYTQRKIGRNTRENIRLNYQYWVALIELTIGARPNEICQLRVEDVKPHEGILCFWIQEKGENQKVKNDNAVRYVPVPDVLFKLGFQSYLDSVSDEIMLFPDLTYTKKAGYYGKVESWFTRNFTEPMKLTDQKKSFYSMRHSFIGFFQERRENCLVLRRLVGHENDTITDNVYGGDVPIKLLKEKIDQYDVSDILEGVLPFKVATH